MQIDRHLLASRFWAIPALSGLFVLHHDFQISRLTRVSRLVCSDTAVDVELEYGVCNVSGNVIDSTRFNVKLDRAGTIGVRKAPACMNKAVGRLPEFLAGEIFRETRRWSDAMDGWLDDAPLETGRATVLAMVSAMLACPFDDMQIATVKDVHEPGSMQKIVITAGHAAVEITPFGRHGANLFMKTPIGGTGLRRYVHQEYDMREEGARAKHARARVVKSAWLHACHVLLLPFAWLLHVLDANRNMAELDVSPELAERSHQQ